MLKRFKYWVIRKTFEKHYGNFIYPFLNADNAIERLPEPTKLRYYETIKEWRESKPYKVEMNCLIRKFYQELCLKTTTEETRSGYRLALIWLKNYENRLKMLADKYDYDKETNKTLTKL